MASHSFHSHSLRHHPHHRLRRRHSIDCPPSASSSSPRFLKRTVTATAAPLSQSSSGGAAFSLSPSSNSSTAAPPSAADSISLDLLHRHLSSGNFRQADEETRRLLIALAGEAAQKRGYVFFSEVQFIPEAEIKAIDELWKQHSDGRFGYSVQKKIWKKAKKDFTAFFLKVGWMKKLDTEVEQYNYRSFPTEFIWELTDQTPEGHLPLTNALRGTQLLNSILSHPAFDDDDNDDDEDDGDGLSQGLRGGSKALSKGGFKPDYSF
ncbi:tetrapyrrole-binding protein, chloroplastic [Diospyros lotus]|uniref:tetrapyrrole-binding protein, chloroplastic n=1 Tax=Diospyros lotus TaxID=55363 RepID=UPI0022560695|nr:tetrapyrrole-binding protein, chloroplastic [Diospyros lotus]